MAEKSRVLSKAQAFSSMGLEETAGPVWSSAASYEERIAPLLEVIGRDAEAALHRASAASCFVKSGDLSRAANLYRAALAGPLSDAAKLDVERELSACLKQLHRAAVDSVAWTSLNAPRWITAALPFMIDAPCDAEVRVGRAEFPALFDSSIPGFWWRMPSHLVRQAYSNNAASAMSFCSIGVGRACNTRSRQISSDSSLVASVFGGLALCGQCLLIIDEHRLRSRGRCRHKVPRVET
jgi:hypothetical protein